LLTTGISSVFAQFAPYAVKYLGYQTKESYALSSGSLFFLFNCTALAGGIAGRFYDHKRIVAIAGIYTATGLALISLHNLAMIGLSAFAVGAGFIIPNIYTVLSRLYTSDDPRRNVGFTVMYLAFNIGLFINMLLSGIITQHLGYANYFLISSVVTIFGTLLFITFDRELTHNPLINLDKQAEAHQYNRSNFGLLATMIVITGITRYVVDEITLNMIVIGILCGIAFIYLIALALTSKQQQRKHKIALILMMFLGVLAWLGERLCAVNYVAYSHMFTSQSINFWGYANMDTLSIISAIADIFFTLSIIGYWICFTHRKQFYALPKLFAIALLITALALLMLTLAQPINVSYIISFSSFLLILSIIFISIAQAIITPLYYAMIGKLALRENESVVMGIFQLFVGMTGIVAISLGYHYIPEQPVMVHKEHEFMAIIHYGLITVLILFALLAIWLLPVWRRHIYPESRIKKMIKAQKNRR
jgi:POT family proton-dependent oligopeptide transporter